MAFDGFDKDVMRGRVADAVFPCRAVGRGILSSLAVDGARCR